MDSTTHAYVSRLLGLLGDDDPVAVLAQTPVRLSQLVASADSATAAHKPAPSRWSINEIVAHMADAELVATYRLRTILTINGTRVQAYDQDRWASMFDYRSSDARVSAQLFSAYRQGTLRVVRVVPPSLLDNHGMHDERGMETARQLITLLAGHDRNHLAQIEGLLSAAGSTT